MKKLIKCISVVLSLCIIVSSVIFFIFNNSSYEFYEKYSFSEIDNVSFSLSEREKENIVQRLKTQIIDNEDYFGFKSVEVGDDLYLANSIMEIAKLIDTKYLSKIKDELSSINQVNLSNLDILNLMYYANICNTLKIDYNQDELIDRLKEFYDIETNLFFLNSSTDTINMKITITSLLVENMPSILKNNEFHILTGINSAYNNYQFATNENKTLYNSGGDIIYGYYVSGLINDTVLEENEKWFGYWQNFYESTDINSLEAALAYVEYIKVAKIFDEKHTYEKIQNFYNNLTPNDLPVDIDYLMLSNLLKNIDISLNSNLVKYIENDINKTLSSGSLVKGEIDLLTTVYGVILCKNTDFTYNKDNLQKYIVANYNKIEDITVIEDKVNTLYYSIILEQINSNYSVGSSYPWIQKVVNDIVNEIDNIDEINQAVYLSRKILEIVVCLQLYEVDVNLNVGQVKKLEKIIKKALEETEIIDSIYISDLLIMDDILNTNYISDKKFYKIYEKLSVDGGCKIFLDDKYAPDVSSTYRFRVCFDRLNNYSNLFEQQTYVNKLKVDNGIYCYSLDDKTYISFESIVYANSIIKNEFGGDK